MFSECPPSAGSPPGSGQVPVSEMKGEIKSLTVAGLALGVCPCRPHAHLLLCFISSAPISLAFWTVLKHFVMPLPQGICVASLLLLEGSIPGDLCGLLPDPWKILGHCHVRMGPALDSRKLPPQAVQSCLSTFSCFFSPPLHFSPSDYSVFTNH